MQKETESSSTEGFPDQGFLYRLFRLFKSFHQSKSTSIPDVWGLQILHFLCPSVPSASVVWLSHITCTSNGKLLDVDMEKNTIGTTWVNWERQIQQLEDSASLSSPRHSYVFHSKNLAWVTQGPWWHFSSITPQIGEHEVTVSCPGTRKRVDLTIRCRFCGFWLQTIPAPLANESWSTRSWK